MNTQNSTTYYELQKKITKYFGNSSVTSAHVTLVNGLLGIDVIKDIINEILNNPELMETIANRSYTHALGFDKIVLMDLSKDVPDIENKTQLRFHIWNPENINALPIVESLHEHSFDFISTVLTGNIENQQFLQSPISIKQEQLLQKMKTILDKSSNETIKFINEQIEICEAERLSLLGSEQFYNMKMSEYIDYDKLSNITGFSYYEILDFCSIQGHYVSDRVSGDRKSYKHILNEYISLSPFCVMKLPNGTTYFHPYQMPHRLYYDNTVLNSTMLITTNVPSNSKGGSLQRPTYIQNKEQQYNKIALTTESLTKIFKNYLNYLHLNKL